jgi:hypothetical protein
MGKSLTHKRAEGTSGAFGMLGVKRERVWEGALVSIHLHGNIDGGNTNFNPRLKRENAEMSTQCTERQEHFITYIHCIRIELPN